MVCDKCHGSFKGVRNKAANTLKSIITLYNQSPVVAFACDVLYVPAHGMTAALSECCDPTRHPQPPPPTFILLSLTLCIMVPLNVSCFMPVSATLRLCPAHVHSVAPPHLHLSTKHSFTSHWVLAAVIWDSCAEQIMLNIS